MPTVSVVIPTHNRAATLPRTLAALTRQSYPLEDMEVVVVADGCIDNTIELIENTQADYELGCITLPGSGPAAARNAGAAAAAGDLLIFIDDDIEAAETLVSAHVYAHQKRPGGLVIGYLPPKLSVQQGFFRTALLGWWEVMFDRMRRSGYRFSYSDLLTGNLSVSSKLFQQIGGFDTELWCHEDFEFGLRALQLGLHFQYSEQAWGYHHELTELPRTLYRKQQEGVADVQLLRKHPDLYRSLPITNLHFYSRWPSRFMRQIMFRWPLVSNMFAVMIQKSLSVWEAFKFRGLWQRTLDGLMAHWYWRGVSKQLPSIKDVNQFLQEYERNGSTPVVDVLDVELIDGMQAIAAQLDEKRPDSVRIYYLGNLLGELKWWPGAERIHGGHIAHLLAEQLYPEMLIIAAEQKKDGLPLDISRLYQVCGEWIGQRHRG